MTYKMNSTISTMTTIIAITIMVIITPAMTPTLGPSLVFGSPRLGETMIGGVVGIASTICKMVDTDINLR